MSIVFTATYPLPLSYLKLFTEGLQAICPPVSRDNYTITFHWICCFSLNSRTFVVGSSVPAQCPYTVTRGRLCYSCFPPFHPGASGMVRRWDSSVRTRERERPYLSENQPILGARCPHTTFLPGSTWNQPGQHHQEPPNVICLNLLRVHCMRQFRVLICIQLLGGKNPYIEMKTIRMFFHWSISIPHLYTPSETLSGQKRNGYFCSPF